MCSYEYAFRIEHLLEKAASTDQKWSFPITYCIVSLNIVNTDPNYWNICASKNTCEQKNKSIL